MFPRGVAGRIQECQVVLQLALVGSWCGAEIERREGKLVNRLIQVAVGPVNSQVVYSHNWFVNRTVVDSDVANPRFVHQSRTEYVSLRHAEKSVMHREIQWEVHIPDIESATKSGGQASGAEGQLGLKIRKEEASRDMVLPTAEVAVVISRELVVRILASLAKHEYAAGRGIGLGKQEPALVVELAVTEIQELERHWIN